MTQRNKEAGLNYWKDKKKGKIKNCLTCGKEFYASPYYINKKKYCSNKCKFEDMKGIKRTEENKKQIRKTLKEKIRKGEIILSPKRLIWSKKRRKKLSKSKQGQNPWNKGLKVQVGKYKYITRNKIKKPESHWVWFDNYGFFPKRKQIIHHKDFNEENNKIENLQLVSISKHIFIHNKFNLESKGKKRGEIKYKEFK